jgi:hypothetical protein
MDNEKTLLEAAFIQLHYMAERRFKHARWRAIDWKEVNDKLEKLTRALEEGNAPAFRENYFFLLTKLGHEDDARRVHGRLPEDPEQLPPRGTRQLLNHIVDRISVELGDPPSPEEPRPAGEAEEEP